MSRVLIYALWESLTWLRGENKHGRDDWRREDIEPEQYVDAIARHLERINAGELIDSESGLPHAAHIVVDAKIFGVKTEGEVAKQLRPPMTADPVSLAEIVGGSS